MTLQFAEPAVPLSAVIGALGMPAETAKIAFLDGQPIGDDRILRHGDTVAFASPLGGG